MIHVRCEEVTLASRRLIPCTLEGLQFILEKARIGPDIPEYAERMRLWFKLQQEGIGLGNELSWVEPAHRSALEANGGFVRASCVIEGLMDPYWSSTKTTRQDLDLLQTHTMGRCFRQTGAGDILEAFRYCAGDNSVHALMCAPVYHFIGKKYEGDKDRMEAAVQNVRERVQDLLLRVRLTPQYLYAGNGLYCPNPAWGMYRSPSYDKVVGEPNLLEDIRQLKKEAQEDE